MAFPADMPSPERNRLRVLSFLVVAVVAAVSAFLAVYILDGDGGGGVSAQGERVYNLEIVGTDIDFGGGNVWHAWTYKEAGAEKGSVPGPTLKVNVGERLVINVTNKLDRVHSLHTHFSNYGIESDGSQINIITQQGTGAMIPPGESWTYEFEPTRPGIFYYHCHSADAGEGTEPGGNTISAHIHQGLYGAIIVKDPNDPPVRDEVIFMSEIGYDVEGDNIPPYIMNGMGLPGGERALEQAYAEGGFDAVAATFNKTVPVISAKVGEELHVSVVNIGDVIHSFHAHNVDHISLGTLRGETWAGNLLPMVPGQADTLQFTFTKPGPWLFHCHVVQHADAGMIGIFNITEDTGSPTQPP
jgi:FtsP/CotA-like multicopper oxidase with cupredoxin domain